MLEVIEIGENPMAPYYEDSTLLKSPNKNPRSGMGMKDKGGPSKDNPTLQDYYLMASDDFLSNSKRTPSYRIGQSLFNCLFRLRPDLARLVISKNLDPFNNSADLERRIKDFILFIEKEWYKGSSL